jgi:hypothetical protein
MLVPPSFDPLDKPTFKITRFPHTIDGKQIIDSLNELGFKLTDNSCLSHIEYYEMLKTSKSKSLSNIIQITQPCRSAETQILQRPSVCLKNF